MGEPRNKQGLIAVKQLFLQDGNNSDGLDDLLQKLISAQRNLTLSINEIPQLLIGLLDDKEIENLKLRVYELLDKFNSVIGPLVEAKNEGEKKIKILETSYGELLCHLKKEQKKVENLEQQINQLETESAGQVNFCSNLGAVLGNLLWKSSRVPQLVDAWLHENQENIGDFLSITNTALESFVDTFRDNFPDVKEDQYKFMMSLLGTVTNVSSNPTGRQFLTKNENGKELVDQVVKLLPMVPSVSGDPMKRLMLMILYNVSLNSGGLPYLINLKVPEVIAKCLDESTDIQVNTLRIIQSITYDLKDLNIFERIFELIPMIKIQKLISSPDTRLSDVARGISENVKRFYSTADTISDLSTNN